MFVKSLFKNSCKQIKSYQSFQLPTTHNKTNNNVHIGIQQSHTLPQFSQISLLLTFKLNFSYFIDCKCNEILDATKIYLCKILQIFLFVHLILSYAFHCAHSSTQQQPIVRLHRKKLKIFVNAAPQPPKRGYNLLGIQFI